MVIVTLGLRACWRICDSPMKNENFKPEPNEQKWHFTFDLTSDESCETRQSIQSRLANCDSLDRHEAALQSDVSSSAARSEINVRRLGRPTEHLDFQITSGGMIDIHTKRLRSIDTFMVSYRPTHTFAWTSTCVNRESRYVHVDVSCAASHVSVSYPHTG